MKFDIESLKKLRMISGASIADCRMALEQAKGNFQESLKWIKTRGFEKAEKKSDRKTSQGLIDCYIHQNGRIGAMVEVLCETDFVAKTSEFKNIVHEICMQTAAMNPKDVDSLLKQDYIRDASKTVEGLVKEAIAKLGENIVVSKFQRFEI